LTRRPLDHELVSRALVADLAEAHRAIDEGRVLVDGSFASKPTSKVAASNQLKLLPRAKQFVSRGGLKLDGALKDLDLDVEGAKCLDAGAGTGGFSDCLLQHGAAAVTAVDVGYGQLDWKLRSDSRVRVVERTNMRTVESEVLGGPYDLVVADLSFISLELIVGNLAKLISPGAAVLVLVKPQFEAPVSDVGKGGVVADPAVWADALRNVARALQAEGIGVAAIIPSRLKGAEGNQEFFVLASEDAGGETEALVQRAVSSVST
jgi:23S rRNA (cytidine1920-2'-O)/16S rRNA (cytidine1409-2'-O)-methyltransferase